MSNERERIVERIKEITEKYGPEFKVFCETCGGSGCAGRSLKSFVRLVAVLGVIPLPNRVSLAWIVTVKAKIK